MHHAQASALAVVIPPSRSNRGDCIALVRSLCCSGRRSEELTRIRAVAIVRVVAAVAAVAADGAVGRRQIIDADVDGAAAAAAAHKRAAKARAIASSGRMDGRAEVQAGQHSECGAAGRSIRAAVCPQSRLPSIVCLLTAATSCNQLLRPLPESIDDKRCCCTFVERGDPCRRSQQQQRT